MSRKILFTRRHVLIVVDEHMTCDQKIEYGITKKFQSKKYRNWKNNSVFDYLPFITVGHSIRKVRRMSECRNEIRLVLKDVVYFRFDFRKRSIDKKFIDYLIDLIIGIIRCTCAKNRW
jgi:hypothetical protein